ncbi:hypothetical protein MO973_26480 [Paenibacillus sp. TRM 82003]|nr:hypothetical protein [Paenibacillus sp. TRM 82003]
MAKTFKSEGRQLAKLVRSAFAALAVLLFVYAFPSWDRQYVALVLAVGWIASELAAWWWVRRRRAVSSARSKGRRAADG